MIPKGKGWYYTAVKKLSAFLLFVQNKKQI